MSQGVQQGKVPDNGQAINKSEFVQDDLALNGLQISSTQVRELAVATEPLIHNATHSVDGML